MVVSTKFAAGESESLVVFVNVVVIRMDRIVVNIHDSIHVSRLADHPADVAQERPATCVTGTRTVIVVS